MKPLVLFVGAFDCGPSYLVQESLEDFLARLGDRITFEAVFASPEIVKRFGIKGTPTLMVLAGEDQEKAPEVGRLLGVYPERFLQSWLEDRLTRAEADMHETTST